MQENNNLYLYDANVIENIKASIDQLIDVKGILVMPNAIIERKETTIIVPNDAINSMKLLFKYKLGKRKEEEEEVVVPPPESEDEEESEEDETEEEEEEVIEEDED